MDKSKRLFLKSKRSFRRRLPPIQSGDRIDYRNMSLISRFISEQGKILSRRVNRLTLKEQRLITIVISNPEVNRTLATLRKAEFGFLGVIVEKLTDKSPLLPLYRTVHEIFTSYGSSFNSLKSLLEPKPLFIILVVPLAWTFL
ncbi:hypothetical protein Patl1_01235 [Pistacia atlantica]|uniref:Uncharacterized protein n=1 Tax=Pistacia atlantica TaxID=434234 RepID=A0ACC1C5U8_9ROSI|nr:hypothetical protein Patl1_01235 [Pistacia atlantica]